MIEFTEHNLTAQKLALHYARKLSDDFAISVFSLSNDVTTPTEAEKITRFYWSMINLAVDDQENEKEIEGVVDLEYWMEKLLNLVMGYLNNVGLGEYWAKVSDEMNGR